MKRWYVANTHARAETRALGHLRRQGFVAYLPQFLKRRVHARRVEEVPAPLFSRYLFVNFDPDAGPWRAILSTVGVQRLICHGHTPTPVPEGVVEEMQAREDETGYIRMAATSMFKRGDEVRITAGALCDRIGLFDCTDDRQRVFLLLELLGRSVRVALPLDRVCLAS